MTKQRPRRARVLRNIRVDEISCVDEGAGEGVKIVMMKRDGKPDYEAFFGRIFGVEKKDTRKNLDVHVDPDGGQSGRRRC